MLHVKITQLDKCHMFLSIVVSVATSFQLSQVSQVGYKCRKWCSDILPWKMTLRRHLKHLMCLIWRRRTGLLKSNNSWHLKRALKQRFWGGALPYINPRSAGSPLQGFRECYNAPLPPLKEHYSSWRCWHFPKAYQGALQLSNVPSKGALPNLR